MGTLRESLSPTPVTQDIYKLNVTCYTYSRLFRFCLDHNGNAHARLPISIILFACKLHVNLIIMELAWVEVLFALISETDRRLRSGHERNY